MEEKFAKKINFQGKTEFQFIMINWPGLALTGTGSSMINGVTLTGDVLSDQTIELLLDLTEEMVQSVPKTNRTSIEETNN